MQRQAGVAASEDAMQWPEHVAELLWEAAEGNAIMPKVQTDAPKPANSMLKDASTCLKTAVWSQQAGSSTCRVQILRRHASAPGI